MIKRTITYTNFNGEEKTRDCYFHLSQEKLTQLQVNYPGGFGEAIKQATETQDLQALFNVFRTLILTSYGEKSEDGESFIQNEKLSEQFSYTPAYAKLYEELMANDTAASDFINAVIPAIEQQQKK